MNKRIKPSIKNLEKIEALFIEPSAKEQQEFFNEWHNAKGTVYYSTIARNYKTHKLVQSTHTKLLELYGMILRAYHSEEAYNKKAFFNYICALDFL